MYGKSVTCYAHKPLFAASIPSIPQGFALSTDVVFAKVHDIFAVFILCTLVLFIIQVEKSFLQNERGI